MSNVFGVIVAGRLVQTSYEQVDATHFVTTLNDADTINHIVVFLTGLQPFPDHMGGAAYIRWPQLNETQPNWYCLGYIANSKPSAIFKVGQLKHSVADVGHQISSGLLGNQILHTASNGMNVVQIGISVEPLGDIVSKVPAVGTDPNTTSDRVSFAQKMLTSLVNHCQSFVVRMPKPAAFGQAAQTADYIPASALQDWYAKFERRIQLDPEYWKNLS